MKAISKLFITVMAFFYAMPVFAQNFHNGNIRNIAVYGDDDRKDYFEADKMMRAFADSTVILFSSADLVFDEKNNIYKTNQATVETIYNLKEGERFHNQPAVSACSGALVGDDMVFTAGHCTVGRMTCENTKIVFGYAIKKKGVFPIEIPAKEVYSCKEVIAKANYHKGEDYALLKLDRKVSGHTPLAINRNKNLKVGTKLFVIGYPNGMPVKIAENAEIRAVRDKYFVTNLDTFSGNSGSPVFNAKTYLIEGILVRGDGDYKYEYAEGIGDGDYEVGYMDGPVVDPASPFNYKPGTTMRYEQNGGRGEDATKIFLIEAFIPQTKLEVALIEAQKKNIDFSGEIGNIQTIPGHRGETEIVPAVYYPEPEPERVNVYKI